MYVTVGQCSLRGNNPAVGDAGGRCQRRRRALRTRVLGSIAGPPFSQRSACDPLPSQAEACPTIWLFELIASATLHLAR
jgi:hypothetical protein